MRSSRCGSGWRRSTASPDTTALAEVETRNEAVRSLHWLASRERSADPEDGVIVDLEDDPGGLPHDELLQTGGEIVDPLVFPSS